MEVHLRVPADRWCVTFSELFQFVEDVRAAWLAGEILQTDTGQEYHSNKLVFTTGPLNMFINMFNGEMYHFLFKNHGGWMLMDADGTYLWSILRLVNCCKFSSSPVSVATF